jgi:tetratricopeptide (TPR) repeat protein
MFRTSFVSRASDYRTRGWSSVELKQYDEALADFSHAIRLDPADSSACNMRGVAWQRKDDNQRAIADFTLAVRLNPRNVVALTNRAWLRDWSVETSDAIKDCDLAIMSSRPPMPARAISVRPCTGRPRPRKSHLRARKLVMFGVSSPSEIRLPRGS